MTFEEWLEFYSPGAREVFTDGEITPLRAAWDAALAQSEKRRTVAPHVDGRDFYELCQQYRHSKEIMPHPSLPNTVQAFNNLREYIKTGKLPWPSYESDSPAHTDHPLRHFDRTCPACIADAEASHAQR